MELTEHTNRSTQTLAYLAAVMLVPVYVSLFPVWQKLSNSFDRTILMLLPVTATLVLLGTIILAFRRCLKRQSASGAVVAAGITVCIAALWIPDPSLPAKKIHVAEYLLLSGVVRFAMSFRLQSRPLLFFSFFFTLILGIHDEFLQGFHSARTYGLRDMLVNGVGAGGGALIWHGFNLFDRKLPGLHSKHAVGGKTEAFYLCWLLLGIFCLVWPCTYYTGSSRLPFWPGMLLIGGVFYYRIAADWFRPSMKHGLTAVSIGSFSLVLYCLLSNVTKITFF